MKGALLIVVAVVGFLVAWERNVFGKKPTAENIMAVQPGMTMAEVRALLGRPLDEDVRRRIQFVCKCNPQKACMAPSSTSYTYTRKPDHRAHVAAGPLGVNYAMLWVHFNERGKVKEVFVKEYQGIEAIRVLHTVRLSPCDSTDRTVEHVEWAPDPAHALHLLKQHF